MLSDLGYFVIVASGTSFGLIAGMCLLGALLKISNAADKKLAQQNQEDATNCLRDRNNLTIQTNYHLERIANALQAKESE